MTVRKLIEEEMYNQNLNMNKLAKLSNLDSAAVTRFFRKGKVNHSFRSVARLAKALNMDPVKLFEAEINGTK